MPTPCFWLEPTAVAWRYLRRFTYSSAGYAHSKKPPVCPLDPGEYSSHNAKTRIEDAPLVRDEVGYVETPSSTDVPEKLAEWVGDPRWPTHCGCGYEFAADDQWQLFVQPEYRRADTGELTTLQDAPAGAMWDAFWMPGPWFRGPDGICLTVKTPGGEWSVDQRASNCGLPDDSWEAGGHHYCWIRHNDPREVPCRLTVDKAGKTCSAGGGSIVSGSYHGFLTNGCLVP
jgi:hypothetical protein